MMWWRGLAVALLLLASVAACGDDGGSGDGESNDSSSYCDDLKDAKEQFASLGSDDADPAKLEDAFSAMQKLGDEAPEAVAGDWDVLTGGFDKIEQALDDAGISLDELDDPAALTKVDPAAAQKLAQEFSSLDSDEFSGAADAISKHAKDECDVDLDDSGSG